MPYNPAIHQRRSIRLKGYDYTTIGAYFITVCTHQRQCLLGEVVNGEMQLNQFGEIVQAHWQNLTNHHSHIFLDAFVVMPNHIHGIIVIVSGRGGTNDVGTVAATDGVGTVAATDGVGTVAATDGMGTVAATDGVGAGLANMPSDLTDNLSAKPAPTYPMDLTDDPSAKPAPTYPMDLTDNLSAKPAPTLAHAPIISKYHGIPEIVRGFKTFSARRINKIRRTAGIPVWQRNYYEHIIRDEQAWQNVRQYIFVNPVAWQEDRLFSEQ